MHYATIDNKIGQSDNPPQDSIEITADQYSQAMQHKLSGGLVTVNDGEIVLYDAPVYAPDGTERKERASDEPLITTAPPDDLYVPQWDGDQWVEGETDAQRQARLEQEKQDVKQALKRHREQQIANSTVVLANGAELKNDEQTRSRVSQTIGYLENTSATQVTWSAVNGPHVLELADLQESVQKGGQAMQAAFDAYATTLTEIEDGTLTTTNEVKARFDELMAQS